MGESPISDRLFQYLQHKGIGLSSFAYNCGLSKNALLQITPESKRIFNKIHIAYPDLNQEWLKFGIGNMVSIPRANQSDGTENAHIIQPTPPHSITIISPKKTILQRTPKSNRIMAIWSRIDVFKTTMGITEDDFNIKLGVDFNFRLLNDSTEIMVNLICGKYPNLNSIWIMSGEGEMLKHQPHPKRPSRTAKWMTGSIGYKWAMDRVMEGIPRKEIIAEFNRRHESNPVDYSTRTGKILSAGILSGWIKRSGMTPPISDKPHPYKKPDKEAEEKHECKPMIAAITDEPIKQEENIDSSYPHYMPQQASKTNANWTKMFKAIAIGIGIIAGIFLVVWVIAEFVLPAVFIGLLFLSMLFAKK